MSNQSTISKSEVLNQLKKEGVTNLDEFADFLVKSATNGQESGPIVQGTIIYSHGFVHH